MRLRKSQEGLIIAGFALATVMIIALLVTYLSNRVVDMIAIQTQVFFSKQAYWNAYSGMEIATSKKIASLDGIPNADVSFATGTISIARTTSPNEYQGGNKVSTIISTGSDAGGRSRSMKFTIGDPVNIAEAEWNLLAYYPFNGNANDESGNGRNGTVNNDATLTTDRFGNVNSAYSFDGDDDYILAGTAAEWDALIGGAAGSALPFSVSMWINATSLDDPGYFLSLGEVSVRGRYLGYTTGGTKKIDFHASDQALTSNLPGFTTGTWMHVVATHPGGDTVGKVYINGVLNVDSENISSTPEVLANAGLRIGSALDPSGFDGTIDEVAIWNAELNADQVQSLYTNGVK